MLPTTRPSPAVLLYLALSAAPALVAGENLLPDPSFESPKPTDRFGGVFERWGGWKYEGECEFRASRLARTGKLSLLLVGGSNPKIRAWPSGVSLEPGRYRVTAWIRGLDIGTGVWSQTTELMFEERYMPLSKNGTFGWTRLTYVGEVQAKRELGHPSFGLMAPGRLWVDDVSVERVGDDVAITPAPVLGEEEAPIEPPAEFGEGAVRCGECGYRNLPTWGACYACGAELRTSRPAASGPPVERIASFEDGNPFDAGTVVPEHATDGSKALRIDRNYACMDGPQDWTGYDWLLVDAYTDAKRPLDLYFEVRDTATTDYWTRVNYTTVVPPGSSTLRIPTALYVGEKSRPGRPLILNGIVRVVFSIGEAPEAPLYLDDVRLVRDDEAEAMRFEGLWAFDLGTGSSPVLDGFDPLDLSKAYAKGRGYGWKAARFWRAFDALQPDPLYRDFICIEEGGLAIDVPDGRYRVFVNMDSPSGYWGEFQRYRRRALIVEGTEHEDTMDLAGFLKRYYRFWKSDDTVSESAFEKYQDRYFREKSVVADVRDGQLNIDFRGTDWACSVSAIVAFPEAKAAEGERFLRWVRQRRRLHFENAFQRVVDPPTGAEPEASPAERDRGFVAFRRDWMEDVRQGDRPLPGERVDKLSISSHPGELEPCAVSVLPLRDLGLVTVTVGDLEGPGPAIPASAFTIGYVSHRLSRVTMEGSVYTIAPRLIVPRASVDMPAGITRTFWLTAKVPEGTPAGTWTGALTIATASGARLALTIELSVRKGPLDPVDLPVGPWGHTIDLPWYEDEVGDWNRAMAVKSLAKLREYGFTTFSGLPLLTYRGFRDGAPDIDFAVGDAQMRRARELGFSMPVVTYCPFIGLDTYNRDEAAMKAAGFSDYPELLRAVFGAVQRHADSAGWLPVYWNIGDEPIGDALVRSAENAEAYRKAFPEGPPWFTAASSFQGTDAEDPHFRLSRALHVADWNLHDEAGVRLLRDAGGKWAFYNGGNRWTFGVYLFKAAKEFGLAFRLSWHWNVVAGDPYYALDCREDDYAWCNSTPDGELVPSVELERLREGLDDYRRLLTLTRLIRESSARPEAKAAAETVGAILGAFRLGDRELKGAPSFAALRERLDGAIDSLR